MNGREPRAPRGETVSPHLILIIPPLCWAGNFVIGRATHAEITPLMLTFGRWLVASLVLVPIAGAAAWRARRALARHWRLLTVLALTGVVGFQYCVYRGLQTTTAINGVLIIATIPVVIPLIAFALDGTRLGARQCLGIAVSLAGVVVIVCKGDPTALARLSLSAGDGWMALAVPNWALYTVLVRRRPADVPPFVLLLATALIGVAVLAPAFALASAAGQRPAPGWGVGLGIAYVGIVASVVAFAAWNHGIARIGANRAGAFIHLMPPFAAVLAIIFLDERLAPFHAPGIALIGIGLWLASMTGKSQS
jgi:drug/metabolite transporter (DMT)-like permease